MSADSESRRCKGCEYSFKKNIGCREKKKGKLQIAATIYFLYVMADIYSKLLLAEMLSNLF